jgi:hypothetical protein
VTPPRGSRPSGRSSDDDEPARRNPTLPERSTGGAATASAHGSRRSAWRKDQGCGVMTIRCVVWTASAHASSTSASGVASDAADASRAGWWDKSKPGSGSQLGELPRSPRIGALAAAVWHFARAPIVAADGSTKPGPKRRAGFALRLLPIFTGSPSFISAEPLAHLGCLIYPALRTRSCKPC